MKKLLTLFTSGVLLSSSALAADVAIEGAYARATAPGQPNSAAFMKILNQGEATRLTGASSSVAKVVELHTHIHDQGVMRMRQLEAIELPARTQVELAPGGLHIMLIGLEAPLQDGSKIDMTLEFADGTSESMDVPVEMVMPAGMGQDQPMSQGHKQH